MVHVCHYIAAQEQTQHQQEDEEPEGHPPPGQDQERGDHTHGVIRIPGHLLQEKYSFIYVASLRNVLK